MFKQHNIIAAAELGTSKVSVLVGEYSEDNFSVIGKGELPSDGAVVKGEIADMDLALEKLSDCLDQADLQSGRELNNCSMLSLVVTGCDMDSILSEGTVFVQSDDRRISEDDIFNAVCNSKAQQLPAERMRVNSFDAYYMADNVRRFKQPINQCANTLKAYSHIIHGNSNRLHNFLSVAADAGLDVETEMIFSPAADILGALSDDEMEAGALVIDLGAGVTEYGIIYNNGVMATGVLPIGFDHVANDIAVGLNLPINFCRKFLEDGTLERLTRENELFVECHCNSGSLRKIPVESFNRIADERLREIFEIICARLRKQSCWNNLSAGCVLTGGGADFFRTRNLLQMVCDLPIRIGKPFAVNGLAGELNSGRYSTLFGALRYAHLLCLQQDSRRKNSLGGIRETISGLGDSVSRAIKNLRGNMSFWG